jgi:hypothetical protein
MLMNENLLAAGQDARIASQTTEMQLKASTSSRTLLAFSRISAIPDTDHAMTKASGPKDR